MLLNKEVSKSVYSHQQKHHGRGCWYGLTLLRMSHDAGHIIHMEIQTHDDFVFSKASNIKPVIIGIFEKQHLVNVARKGTFGMFQNFK